MIRLQRPAEPPSLARKSVAATSEIKRKIEAGEEPMFSSGIYAADDVKQALREMHRGKCAFCETEVTHRFHGDVEHFRPKAGWTQNPNDSLQKPGYWWLAYQWSNLFLSCQFCNQRFKKNLFPIAGVRASGPDDDLSAEEALLVNPETDEPEKFVRYRDEVAYAVDGNSRGASTIEILGLNENGNPRGLVESRRDVLLDFLSNLRLFAELREQWANLPNSTQEKVRQLQATLLSFAEEGHEYSAMFRDTIDAYDQAAEVPLMAPMP